MFVGNGFNTGFGYRWGDKWGLTGKVAFTVGQTNEKRIETFAKTLVSSPFIYKVNGKQKVWSQINVAIGPSLMFGKNNKGEIYTIGGIGLNKQNSITIDKYDGNVKLATVFNSEQKKISPFWEIGASYKLIQKGLIGLNLIGIVGSNGGTIGLSMRICHGCEGLNCKCCGNCGKKYVEDFKN